jgi:hypothetical protein
MRIYTSFRSIANSSQLTNDQKKALFTQNYLKAFQTKWPFLGLLTVTFCCVLAKIFIPIESPVLLSLLVGSLAGFIYFQFHCKGIDMYLEQNNRT